MKIRTCIAAAALTAAFLTGCGDATDDEVTNNAAGTPDAVAQNDEDATEEAAPDETNGEPVIHSPETIEWAPGPEVLPEGAEIAVLDGDPSENEYFALRLRLPAEYTIAPHTHPAIERVTVIEGTLFIGHGEEVTDEMDELVTGAYIRIPAEHPHFARTEEETVIQLSTIGPWALNYVNPEDDPRNS